MFRFITAIILLLMGGLATAQPLRIVISDGVIEPIPLRPPIYRAGQRFDGAFWDIVSVLSMDLMRTGLFRALDERAHVGKISSLNAPVEYADWKAINAQVLITGAAATGSGDELTVVSASMMSLQGENTEKDCSLRANIRQAHGP